jgi:IS66 C-terminal element
LCATSSRERWCDASAFSAVIASLVETCKLNDINPLAYLTDALTRIINGHPNSEIDQLLPWAYTNGH